MCDIVIIIRKRMRIKMDIKRIDSYKDERYVSLDGHTRLSVAVDRGYTSVKGFLADGGDWVQNFVHEALLRGILTPYDMQVLSHSEYDLKWNKFCDELFEVK